jgi:integrase
LSCPNHVDQKASNRFIVQFGRKVRKRFDNYQAAERFLDGLRYEVDRGTFDYRDYLSRNPLSFTILSTQYLEKKRNKVKPGTYSHIKRYITVFQEYFGNTNVKEIQYSHIEDLIDSLQVADKTKSNYLATLHNFYNWLLQRKEINQSNIPQFPSINFELGYRKTIDKETQAAILAEIKRLSYHLSPKIWLGIKWLSTYISIRPGEMRDLKEGHIDLKQGFFFIPHPKERRPKIVPLIQEDIGKYYTIYHLTG